MDAQAARRGIGVDAVMQGHAQVQAVFAVQGLEQVVVLVGLLGVEALEHGEVLGADQAVRRGAQRIEAGPRCHLAEAVGGRGVGLEGGGVGGQRHPRLGGIDEGRRPRGGQAVAGAGVGDAGGIEQRVGHAHAGHAPVQRVVVGPRQQVEAKLGQVRRGVRVADQPGEAG